MTDKVRNKPATADIMGGPVEMPPLPEEVAQDNAVETEANATIPEKQPQTVESTPEKQPEVLEQPKPDFIENAKERNLRALREKSERIERERDEAMRRVQELESKQTMQQPIEEDLSINLRDDDLAEGKHLSKVERQIKRLEGQLKAYQTQTAQLTIETRIKTEYPDFDRVVSAENVKELSAQYPELASALNSTPDLYAKAVSAYTMIKKLNLVPDEQATLDRIQVAKNAAKPRPLQSISPQQGSGALEHANAFANGLTPALKDQLWKEMQESMKG
jgi:uncharacterized coiled-coil protein SlyX